MLPGKAVAKVTVPAVAANSEVGVEAAVITVDEGQCKKRN